MKKFSSIILSAIMFVSVSISIFAAEAEIQPYTILVSEQALDLSDLPCAPYREGETIMVPLRKIGEALGYKVSWDAQTGAVTLDDEYIQRATLHHGISAVVFEGHLQIINMSREIENSVPTAVHDGYTYVPLEFFQEFLNDTAVEGSKITIAPSKCEINNGITNLTKLPPVRREFFPAGMLQSGENVVK